MNNVKLCPKTKTSNVSEQSSSLGRCQSSFKDTFTAMFNTIWTTLKKIGINLPIRPSVRPSVNPVMREFKLRRF